MRPIERHYDALSISGTTSGRPPGEESKLLSYLVIIQWRRKYE
jgi:hypothetical protein